MVTSLTTQMNMTQTKAIKKEQEQTKMAMTYKDVAELLRGKDLTAKLVAVL